MDKRYFIGFSTAKTYKQLRLSILWKVYTNFKFIDTD